MQQHKDSDPKTQKTMTDFLEKKSPKPPKSEN
jgi:hypothetical protein